MTKVSKISSPAKIFTGVTSKESTAKALATKATKTSGEEYVAHPSGEGWTIVKASRVAAMQKAAEEAAAAKAVTADKAPAVKTNVVGRASGGAWLSQVISYLEEKGIDKATAQVTVKGTRHYVGDETAPLTFWFSKPERAAIAIAEFTAEVEAA